MAAVISFLSWTGALLLSCAAYNAFDNHRIDVHKAGMVMKPTMTVPMLMLRQEMERPLMVTTAARLEMTLISRSSATAPA